jgi:hypothetical protein
MALSNNPVKPVQPAVTATPSPATPAPAPLTSSDPDIQWALDLEQKVKDGYQPNEADTTRYQQIAAKVAAQAAPAEEAAETHAAESSKGLLDYPKDVAMGISEYAAAGTAKNTVGFLEDMHEIAHNGGEIGDHLKHGEVLKAGGNVLHMGWGLLKGIGHAVTTGAWSTVGGVTMVAAVPLNLLDKGGEVAGKKLRQSDSAVGHVLGQGLKFLAGENSNKGYLESIQGASREATIKAMNHTD